MATRSRSSGTHWADRALEILPSGVGFAVGMYISPKFTLPRVLGTLIEQIWLASCPHNYQSFMVVTASGLVLGEGTAALLLAVGKSLF